MAFGLYATLPVPMPADEFPPGIQVQQDELDVGPPNPQFISFDSDFTLTYDPITGTVHVQAVSAGTGGGGAAQTAQGVRATLQSNQNSGQDVIFNDVIGFGNWDGSSAGFNPATGVYTVPASGDGYVHAISAEVFTQNGGEAGTVSNEASLLLNGTTTLSLEQADVPTTGYASHTFRLNGGQVLLAAGDQIKVAFANALTNNLQAIGGPQTHLSIIRLFQP